MPATVDLDRYIGREPERLTLEERMALTGKWIAVEFYSPATLPLRRIEAMGSSVNDCITRLNARGLDPRRYEFSVLPPPH